MHETMRQANRRRILVADDELHSVTILRDFLDARGFEVVTAMDGTEALDRFFEDGPFDLVLLDVMMPGVNGWEVCSKIKSSKAGKKTPVLMVSALGQPEHIERGRREGADDYMSKPVRFLDLDARVQAMLDTRSERVGSYQSHVQPSLTSEVLSPIDTLTGLFNSHYFAERLHREFHRSGNHRGRIALLLMEPDLDLLRPGNSESEIVLCQIARAIGDAILPRDVACRLEGSRFAVIACGAKAREALRLAEMIRWGVERATRGASRDAGVTLTVGLAHRDHLIDAHTPDQLLNLAGSALASARERGRNQVVEASELAGS
jgi:diguanylate cyclase (GGDEF)-like protein